MSKDYRKITAGELAKHASSSDAWIVVNGLVYDVTAFAESHPGGAKLLLDLAGKDASTEFFELHRMDVLEKYAKLVVGILVDENGEPTVDQPTEANRSGISEIPFVEPPSMRPGWTCPYTNESHDEFRLAARKYFTSLRAVGTQMENAGKPPTAKLMKEFGDLGIFAGLLGPGDHLKGRTIFGVKGEDFDHFHESILSQERARLGLPSFNDSLGTGLTIGLPPVNLFAQEAVREKVVGECIRGEKTICLAITEPWAGSDVANIRTTAVLSECGKYYIVNGAKKWITNGDFSDYFTTAVRTGGPGVGGVSLLCIPRVEGVETKIVKTSYGSSAGTALIIFENAKVPVEYLLGAENEGFQVIMANFNHERWYIVCLLVGGLRGLLDEAFLWCNQRRAFGGNLLKQPVVRQKLAEMVTKSEGLACWLDMLTFQMMKMDRDSQFMLLGPHMTLLKYHCSRAAYEFNDCVVQIFGGRALSISGMGAFIEKFQRQIKYGAILGGSEEVMADLGIRLAVRGIPPDAKL